MRATFVLALAAALLSACAEPFREQGTQYTEAAVKALAPFRPTSSTSKLAFDGPYWNDCGQEVTCLFLYGTNDDRLVEAVVVSLLTTQSRIKKPGIKLTVYSSSHLQPKVVFREVTIQ